MTPCFSLAEYMVVSKSGIYVKFKVNLSILAPECNLKKLASPFTSPQKSGTAQAKGMDVFFKTAEY